MHTKLNICYLVMREDEPIAVFTTKKEVKKEIDNRKFTDYKTLDDIYEDSGYWIKEIELISRSAYEKPKKTGIFSYFWIYDTQDKNGSINCSFNNLVFFNPKEKLPNSCPEDMKFGQCYKYKREEDENFDTIEALLLLDIPKEISFEDFINYAKRKIIELYLKNLKENKNIIYID